MFSPLYTVLLLAPSRSFLPLFKEYRAFSLYDFIRHDTRIEAELFCVTQGLAGVADRWSALDDYFDRLLVDDFMEPTKYSKLLFDDENFTRSRKYFWAIGCLNEFDVSIADNIKQWDLYYEGSIKPALDKLNLAELFDAARLTKPKSGDAYNEKRVQEFENLAKQARRHRDILENLRTQFKNKLETVKTLRDGLFNASALVESRASTRLGQNVKLLTYVSIFYLPLAFCAALWAIPNIQEKSTKVPFVVTSVLVGFVTYFIVFNMDFMTNKLKMWYLPRRQNVVTQMQNQNDWWNQIGQRFEEFKPSSESKVPTEWWIPLYVAHQALKKRTWTWKKGEA
ncbi:hypothetical protein L207DRAFT_440287 [Hyaloscypha variabilis F]|uniref:Uncharacterized protein n=1 Tax=Hyaloscypha variabilis (strain UAMH 11265 / GT02V1 / F) TaxID=1149755 RepID=A0A2J6R294_HYAVF|nr:hypothetical protein L207DRAFT_440287 [Hyaloscypha variabilis F]